MPHFSVSENQKWIDTLPKRISSAAMILEDDDGGVVVVKANYKTYWTFPGGIIDPGETPRQGAVREVLEEVGIKINPADVEFVAIVDRVSDFVQTYQFIFKTRIGTEMMQMITLQPSEIDEYATVTKQQVVSEDRQYAKAVQLWVDGVSGYVEQVFIEGKG